MRGTRLEMIGHYGTIVSFVKYVTLTFQYERWKRTDQLCSSSNCMHCLTFFCVFLIQVNKGSVAYCIACWTSKQKSRSVSPLFESHWWWHSGMKKASCGSWSSRLSAKELFKAVQVHRHWLPGKINARTALKDSSLEQSLGTETEAHLWQSFCDITHHGGNLRRAGRWKTQVAYSIYLIYSKCSRTCTFEECSTANSKPICDCVYFLFSVAAQSFTKKNHKKLFKWLSRPLFSFYLLSFNSLSFEQ